MSEKGMKMLQQKGLLKLIKEFKVSPCEVCVLGKSTKLPYKQSFFRAGKCLEYIHCDLWGPARTETLGGGKYFLSIMDDFSRKVWILLLKNKSDTLSAFKTWISEVENEKHCSVQSLRTDNGMEFLSNKFQELCRENGIKRKFTVPGNPQQNGVVKRMNRTLLDRVRSMLISSSLPKCLWGEAVSTASYLINNSPSAAL